MRRVAVIVLALIVLVPCLAAAGAWLWFDPAIVRARLQDAAARATGRELVIDGPVTLAWGPRLRVEGLRLLNPPGLSRLELARVASAEIGVALAPLVSGRVELRGVRFDGVDVLLERDAAGRGNWERPSAPVPTSQSASASAPVRRMEVSLDSAILTNAMLSYRDLGKTWTVQVPQLTIDGGRRIAGHAVVADVPVRIAGTGPFPLTLEVSADRLPAGALVIVAPRLTLAADGPDAPVRIDAVATVGSAPVTVGATSPSLRRFLLDGVLDRLDATLGDATLVAEGRLDTRSPDAAFTVRAHVPALAAVGAALGQAWPDLHNGDVAMQVTRTGTGVNLDGTGALAGSDATFLLGVGWARPRLEGTVTANRIDLDTLLVRVLPPPTAAPAVPASPAAEPSAPGPQVAAVPPTPLPFAALTRADGDVRLTIGTLRWRGTDITGVAGRVVLDRGVLTIDPAHAVLGGGPVDASLIATALPPHAVLTVVAPGSDAAAIATLGGVVPAVTGRAELDVALDGTGLDVPALLASVTGRIGLAMVGGEADLAAIPGLTAGLAQMARGAPLPAMGTMKGRTPIRCLALRTDLAGGRATVAALVFDTPRLTLTGEGAVDLTDRTFALRLRPSVAVGRATVSAPLRVTGPWATPAIKMDGDGGRAGISIATATAPEPDQCGPALALARNGRPGPAPSAPEPPKPAKPADLLRSLLR